MMSLPVSAAFSEHARATIRPGAVWPVPGIVVRGFDPPAQPYGPGHRGVDLLAPGGMTVRAALPGTVQFAGRVAGRGWVTLDHGGDLVTTYGDLQTFAIGLGDRVEAGDALGTLATTADHLDWGAKLDGAYIDPRSLLVRWPVALVAGE